MILCVITLLLYILNSGIYFDNQTSVIVLHLNGYLRNNEHKQADEVIIQSQWLKKELLMGVHSIPVLTSLMFMHTIPTSMLLLK